VDILETQPIVNTYKGEINERARIPEDCSADELKVVMLPDIQLFESSRTC